MRRLADDEVLDELAAQRVDLLDDVVDQRVRQTELGDAVAQHAAEVVERLEHRDGIALGRQQIGVDQAGGTGTDHRDRRLLGPLPRGNIIRRDEGGVAAFLASEALALRQVPFELADLDRPAGDGADALALQFLRADAAGDVRQRVARLDQREGLLELALAHQVQHVGDMDGDRAAAFLALWRRQDALLARPVLALLVAQHFEPHEQSTSRSE